MVTMDTCLKDFVFCEDGCCHDHSIHCCNITCTKRGRCYVAPSTPEEITNELLGSLFGLVFMGILYLLIKFKCQCPRGDCLTCECCSDCDSSECCDNIYEHICLKCKRSTFCTSVKCPKFTICIGRNQQNEDPVQENVEDVRTVLEPVSHSIQHTDIDIPSNGISHESANENSETQSFLNIITEPPDNNRTINVTETVPSSEPPSYEEVTRNDPPPYTVAIYYPSNSSC